MPPLKTSKSLGNLAEASACIILQKAGYRVIERNFRSRFGEIDIIAVKDDTLVFVEVKARWSKKFGAPEEAVTQSKIWKIQRTGEYYSTMHPELPKKLRIDVVALEITNNSITSSKIIPVY